MEKRLVSSEFNQVRRFAAFISEIQFFQEYLKDNWKLVENGEERADKLAKDSIKLFEDLLDTIPANQVRTIRNTMKDYKVTFIPQMSPQTQNIILDKESAKELINIAHEQCKDCVKTPEEAENCILFKLSTGIVPPDSYESLLCAYSQAEWLD